MGRRELRGSELRLWAEFVADLREFWTRAGSPSSVEMAHRLRGSADERSDKTLATAIPEAVRNRPSWAAVRGVLRACDASDDEIARWRIRHSRGSGGRSNRAISYAAEPNVRGTIWNPDTPFRVVEYVGRAADMDTVDHLFGEGRPIVLRGMRGVGKTQLAVQLTDLARSRYAIVWWVDGRRNASVRSSLAKLAARLLDPAPTGLSDDDLAELALTLLADRSDWLLVVDAAPTPDVIGDRLPRMNGDILVTAAYGHWPTSTTIVDVLPLSRTASVQLLGGKPTRALRALANELGGFPLLLLQVRAVLEATGISPADYLHEMRGDPASVLRAPLTPDDHRETIERSWRVTLRYSRIMNARATKVLEALSYGAADAPIPATLLVDRSSAAQALWPADFNDVAGITAHLREFSLVLPAPEGFAIHGQVAHALHALSTDGQAACRDLIRHLTRVLPFDSDARGTQDPWRKAISHVLAACDRFAAPDPDVIRERIWLCDRAATYFKGSGHDEEAIHLFERADQLAESHLQPDDSLRLFVRGNLLLGAHDAGTMTADDAIAGFRELARVYENVVSGRMTLTGTDDAPPTSEIAMQLADAHHNIGFIGMRSGSHPRAVDALLEAFRRYSVLWPTRDAQFAHPAYARVHLNLAWAWIELHDYARAQQAAERALELIRRGPLKDGPDHITALNNLAMSLQEADPARGARLMVDVIRRRTSLLGERHAATFAGRVNRARLLLCTAELGANPSRLRAALRAAEKLLTQADSPVSEATDANRATLCRAVGRGHRTLAALVLKASAGSVSQRGSADVKRDVMVELDHAEAHLNVALAQYQRMLAADHPILMDILYERAQVELLRRRPHAAIKLLNAAVTSSSGQQHALQAQILRLRGFAHAQAQHGPAAKRDRAAAERSARTAQGEWSQLEEQVRRAVRAD